MVSVNQEKNIRTPNSESEWKKYFDLRYRLLRKPWGKPVGSEKDKIEKECIHAAYFNGDKVLGVCRLQKNNDQTGQVRYMAVEENTQGQGIGKKIMHYIEEQALKRGMSEIVLHARENARKFYESAGYVFLAKSYLLYGEIPHYKMLKRLT
jgi:predicted GNAT family N-acyltransferase